LGNRVGRRQRRRPVSEPQLSPLPPQRGGGLPVKRSPPFARAGSCGLLGIAPASRLKARAHCRLGSSINGEAAQYRDAASRLHGSVKKSIRYVIEDAGVALTFGAAAAGAEGRAAPFSQLVSVGIHGSPRWLLRSNPVGVRDQEAELAKNVDAKLDLATEAPVCGVRAEEVLPVPLFLPDGSSGPRRSKAWFRCRRERCDYRHEREPRSGTVESNPPRVSRLDPRRQRRARRPRSKLAPARLRSAPRGRVPRVLSGGSRRRKPQRSFGRSQRRRS
jgi:hypothetical protein